MTPEDVLETAIVAAFLIAALRLRYADRAAERKHRASEAAKVRAEAKAARNTATV